MEKISFKVKKFIIDKKETEMDLFIDTVREEGLKIRKIINDCYFIENVNLLAVTEKAIKVQLLCINPRGDYIDKGIWIPKTCVEIIK